MSFSLSFNLATPAGLADLNAFLQSRSYVVGFTATQKDVELFNAIGKAPDAAKYPNVARFFSHVASFSADAKAKLPAGFGAAAASAPAAKAAAPAAAAAEEEEDVDLFGDDADAAAAKVAAAAPKVEEKPKKKEKVPELNKSSCMYEVKPLEAGQDMKKLEDSIRAISIDGLVWGSEFKVVDVAFGIQKLIVPLVLEDEKVGLEDLEEKILALEDQVQSLDLLNMNKVSGR